MKRYKIVGGYIDLEETNGPTPPPTKDFGGLFPSAQGFGSGALQSQPLPGEPPSLPYGLPNRAGRGGSIYIIDTLEDNRNPPVAIKKAKDGTQIFKSSLRSALEAQGPRYIISEVGGNIAVDYNQFAHFQIVNPFCTLALQNAPSPGINIVGQLNVVANDVLLQHFRIRFPKVGVKGSSDTVPLIIGDATGVGSDRYAWNVMCDHLSIAFARWYMSWASANMVGGTNPWDVNISNCILSYPLTQDDVSYQGYGFGFWTVGRGQVTAHRNLTIHSSHRNINGGSMKHQYVANRIYGSGDDDNWLVLSVQAHAPGLWPEEDPRYQTQAVFEDNIFYPSYDTGMSKWYTRGTDRTHHSFNMQFSRANVDIRGDRIYLRGNKGPFILGPNTVEQWPGIHFQQDTFSPQELAVETPFDWHARMDMQTNWDDDKVGARPKDRDKTDLIGIAHYKAGKILDTLNMGQRIEDPSDIGVDIYDVPETRQEILDLPENPSEVVGPYDRTAMDNWLIAKAALVE